MDQVMICCQIKPGGCSVGEGDCDTDHECKPGLRCGQRNCNWYKDSYWNMDFEDEAESWMIPDCCEGTSGINTRYSIVIAT